MVFNTITVSTAVTPTVIETYFSHYLHRKSLHQKPTAHISYHEGIRLIRQFLQYASHHTVEDIQAFTSQWVPSPRWVRVEEVKIPDKALAEAADAVCSQLGRHGVDRVGGQKWWQWRRDNGTLQAEWIEMRRDHAKRKQSGAKSKRIMLYVHGGAYFFGSVDEHRYQMQRHARKLEAREARYRLAPQFPFPCGLHDCLASYLYLLTLHSPNEIILAGDSAGGGTIVSILVILRDRGIALPAGAILISPWVDLTHSFPSVAGDGSRDYIPAHGFHQRPSTSWPPPNSDEMEAVAQAAIRDVVDRDMGRRSTQQERQKAEDDATQGFTVDHSPKRIDPQRNKDNPFGSEGAGERPGNTIPGSGHDLSIMIRGQMITIKDQIQMYTTNQLISHPLVSPILQASLGGLPPLLIMTGGGEVLRDEQIYLAHKAANPSKYPLGDAYLHQYPHIQDVIGKWKPTDVQLQVWDDLCHVGPTLSFTRPAKFMYRSIAQFGAWVLAKAQKTEIEIQDDDDLSIISSGSDTDSDDGGRKSARTSTESPLTKVGKAGDPLPHFKNHMIRQRIDRYGNAFLLESASTLPALQVPPNEIGVIKPGPVQKWMDARKEWDSKYAREKRKVQKQRAKEMAQGYVSFGNDEVPPPSALAGRRTANMPKEAKRGRSWGMSLWSLWGSSHDENTIEREEKADKQGDGVDTTTVSQTPGESSLTNTKSSDGKRTSKSGGKSRSKSRRRTVSYTGQDTDSIDKPAILAQGDDELPTSAGSTHLSPDTALLSPHSPNRPSQGYKAFPFKLGTHLMNNGANASTVTLMSQGAAGTPRGDEQGKQLGESTVGVPSSVSGKERDTTNDNDRATGPDRRATKEDKDGVLHKALVERGYAQKAAPVETTDAAPTSPSTAYNPADSGNDRDSSNGDAAIERRTTREDRDGVIHKALVERGIAKPTSDGPAVAASSSTPAAQDPSDGADDYEDAGARTPTMMQPVDRRKTVEDADGVLHKALTERGSTANGNGKKAERPEIERFETASEGF